MPEQERCFSMGWEMGMGNSMGKATFSGPVAMDEVRLVAAARNSAKEKGEQKDECDSSGNVARRSSKR